jgi:Domain of unknown function (DUF1896).
MSSKNTTGISYFRLSLIQFLQESHPELVSNDKFISSRSETAAETYEQAIRNGNDQFNAVEYANEVLFRDLHFSKHDTLVTIFWNEFADTVPQSSAKELAIKLLPECETVFAKYALSDDFAYSAEFDLLYTELTGTTSIYFEEYGLQ